MRPRVEAESAGAGMLRAYIESNLAFMAENRNHVVATVEIALNARGADGRRLFDSAVGDEAMAALERLLIRFQGTGEFRAGFDPVVMAMAIRAAIDGVASRLAQKPDIDVGHYARELADLFDLAIRARGNPRGAAVTKQSAEQ